MTSLADGATAARPASLLAGPPSLADVEADELDTGAAVVTATDRRVVRVERGEGHPPVVLEVDSDGSTVCPTCHQRVPLQTALRHAGAGPRPGTLLPMSEDDDDAPDRASWPRSW